MNNVYEKCPSFENNLLLIRKIEVTDLPQLFKVYSDQKAVPFFNGDNCHGDTFYYDTIEKMRQALNFWLWSYDQKYFVRWSIVDKTTKQIIGTIEAFHRDSDDEYNNACLLRIDLRSDYEKANYFITIFSLIIPTFYDLFYCDKIVTKGFPNSSERLSSLKKVDSRKANIR